MKLLDGKSISEGILDSVANKVRESGIHPHLAVVLVGDDPASELYVSLKEKAAKSVGVDVSLYKFTARESQKSVSECVKMMSADGDIDGILVQLPLPEGFDTDAIIKNILPEKDLDGFHPQNVQQFVDGNEMFWPVFPKAITSLIESCNQDISGKKAVILANSDEFGEMMAAAFAKKSVEAEYILQNEIEQQMESILNADILVTALGRPGIITGNMLAKNAIVIDGGIAKEDGKVLGDVNRETLADFEGCLSPVPGGVGPVTIACLLENALEAAFRRRR